MKVIRPLLWSGHAKALVSHGRYPRRVTDLPPSAPIVELLVMAHRRLIDSLTVVDNDDWGLATQSPIRQHHLQPRKAPDRQAALGS